jgi:hypothetical protein
MFHHQNADQNNKIANKYLKNVAKFKYLGMKSNKSELVTKKLGTINSGNACCLSLFIFPSPV